jgi:hypothetical protein
VKARILGAVVQGAGVWRVLHRLSILAAVTGGLASCTSTKSPAGRIPPGGAKASEVRISPELDELEELRGAVALGDSGALDRLAGIASAQAEDPAARARVLSLVAGRERELLERLLGRASHEVRDLGPLLRETAAAAVRPEEGALALALIREVAVRECCLRRSLLASALEGLADGFDRVGLVPGPVPEAVKALAGLSALGDPEVSRAAGRVSRFFAEAP